MKMEKSKICYLAVVLALTLQLILLIATLILGKLVN